MPYGLACTLGWGVDDSCEPFGGSKCSWRCIEKYSDSTHPWGLVFTKRRSHQLFGLHGPAGRPSEHLRRFLQHGQRRVLVVLLRLVRVHCLGPPPVRRPQWRLPQRPQPGIRLVGSLLQGLGMCVGRFDHLTIAPDRREGAE